ncbi:hypothetical protein [Luteimonas sp. MC1828]|uniref:hypothetical protein n=1 Tax=Luteimonas sp. MC1828 TaxID=2799787 RepID=UPI0018F1148E|nr:hypothetical protein [Luteimonas sp. MC1828]MBJ7575451.1 hypothetical protein [Luteimonas sp. MC1828]
MRDLLLPALCLVLLCAVGCTSQDSAGSEPTDEPSYDTASGASAFDLTAAEQKLARAAALAGDPAAAKRLAHYYSFIELDSAQSVHWLRIAVRDGDPVTAQNLAYDLHTLGGLENCTESLEILKKIRDSYSDPVFIEDAIRDLQSDFQKCVQHGRWPPNNSFKPTPLRGAA